MSPMSEAREVKRSGGWRITALRSFFFLFVVTITGRLFILQVLSADFYHTIAEGQHSLYEELVPRRGRIYVRDRGDETLYPVATLAPKAFVLADPREIPDPVMAGMQIAKILRLPGTEMYERIATVKTLKNAGRITEARDVAVLVKEDVLRQQAEAAAAASGENPVTPVVVDLVADVVVEPVIEEAPAPATAAEVDVLISELEAFENPTAALIGRLSKKDDPYEPVARGVSDKDWQLIETLNIPGVWSVLEDARAYPETDFGGHVLGFLGKTPEGTVKGFYGVEGYFDDVLAGKPGTLYAQRDVSGHTIGVGKRQFTAAIDGADIVLSIDRALQVMACDALERGVKQFDADSGAVVIMEPKTGRILAMCGVPDFEPAKYGEVEDFSVYNNPAIFTPYEPGSIFKPLTMAAALDVGAVRPESTFTDPGFVEVDDFKIKNSGDKVYGSVTMIQVLEDSINTGMVWVMRRMEADTLKQYIKKFGFGVLTGVELKTEAPGTIASLDERAEVYAATASFGQGITTTPLQIAAAYAALANEGAYMQPHIVDEIHYADGTVEKMQPQTVRQVVSPKTAKTIGAMMVSVVEYGHGKKASVPGYYIAGKTGTAQISKNGLYSETDFNGSFAGYGPVDDPRFAMIVKIENPKNGVIYAESTAAPVFGEIAKFLLSYYGVAPDRTSGVE